MDVSQAIILIIILLILLCISAICSATEIAISSCNIIRIKSLARKGNKRARKAYYLAKNYSHTLTTILIFNNIANTASASIATFLISSKFGANGVLYATIVMTIFILIFGEIMPKMLAKEYSEKVTLKMAGLFSVLIILMKPLCALVDLFEKRFKDKKKKHITATEDELLEIVQTIEFEGVLKQQESELIQNAVEFDDKKVKDIMVDKNDVIFLYDTDNTDVVKKLIIEEKYSRIPIVCKATDKVIGIIHEGDFLDNYLDNKSVEIKDIMKDVIYITKNKRLSIALEKIQKNRMHLAVVIDNNEEHNFLGIITLEDILEELVGEIYDEYDDLPKNVLKIGLHTYQIDPNINVTDFFDEYLEDVTTPEINSKTFVGWINELSPNSVRINQEFEYENIKIKVLETNDKKPTKLEIVVLSNYQEI